MDITTLMDEVIRFRDKRDWAQYHNPKDLAISLSLEASELLEIFQWKDVEKVEAMRSDEKNRRKVKEELGDILIYALTLAHEFALDPGKVILDKIKINERKYPADKVRGRSDKYTAYES